MASQIQREARYPLEVFRTLPTQGWSEELQRFFDQIKSGANALSGMDFFIVTRKLLFAMAGTLITYELVLLQFNSTEIDKEHLVNCNKTFKLWNVLVDVFSLSDFVNKYFLRSNHKLFIANLIVRKSWELLSRTTLRKHKVISIQGQVSFSFTSSTFSWLNYALAVKDENTPRPLALWRKASMNNVPLLSDGRSLKTICSLPTLIKFISLMMIEFSRFHNENSSSKLLVCWEGKQSFYVEIILN